MGNPFLKAPYLIAQKPNDVIANAISTARVTEVLPVNEGSRIEAVKQNLDLCKMKPKEIPVTQKSAKDSEILPRTIAIAIKITPAAIP